MTRATARSARATIAVLALLAAPAATAHAASGPVVNASFEQSSASASSGFTSQNDELPVAGWEFWDPQRLIAPVGDPASGLATVLGIWSPSAHAYPAGLPDGDAVGFVYAADGPGSGELGLRQLTRARLTAGRRYQLRVAIGNPQEDATRGFAVGGFPGYRIELRAGGRVLAREQDRIKPTEGLFAETTLGYSATGRDRSLGARIEIRLVNRNARAGAEVDFDRVRLQAVAASSGGAPLGSGGVAGVTLSGGGAGAGVDAAVPGSSAGGGATAGGAGSTGSGAGTAGADGGAVPPEDSDGAAPAPSQAPQPAPAAGGGAAAPTE